MLGIVSDAQLLSQLGRLGVVLLLFFVSMGMLLDVDFVIDNWLLVLGLTLLVLTTNTFINAALLRCFGNRWREALPGGALLAQVGELSYLLAAVGIQAGIVSEFAHQAGGIRGVDSRGARS